MRVTYFVPTIVASASALGQTVAHWHFDEHAQGEIAVEAIIDSAGGHHGTPFGGPVYQDSTLGYGRALFFDAVNDRIAVPDSPEFYLTEAFTLEAYIRIEAIQWPQVEILFRGDNRGGRDPWFLGLLEDAYPELSIDDGVEKLSVFGPESLPFNKWVHIAGVFDSSADSLSLFINGVRVATTTTTMAPYEVLTGNQPGLGIGNLQNRWHQNFGGQIDEVRISSVALTPDEFLPPACPVDVTGDGRDDTRDVLVFLNWYVHGDGSADWNGDGAVNTQDVLGFLNDWVAGCQ